MNLILKNRKTGKFYAVEELVVGQLLDGEWDPDTFYALPANKKGVVASQEFEEVPRGTSYDWEVPEELNPGREPYEED